MTIFLYVSISIIAIENHSAFTLQVLKTPPERTVRYGRAVRKENIRELVAKKTTDIPKLDALAEANKIALAPFVFQATVALRDLGILNYIFKKRRNGGASVEEISQELNLQKYGISVLLEIAESSDIVEKTVDEKYQLTETGYFLAYNKMVNVNLNFTNDVCYKGLHKLPDSIKTGKPEGLKALGNWPTVYEGLSQLPEQVQKSWFEFDHYYSDGIFDQALNRVFQNNPKLIFDVGANTAKFTMKCLKHSEEVSVKMFDLKGQLEKAKVNIQNLGAEFESRVSTFEIDWLKDNLSIPKGADVIWMSQFLDCFSKSEIIKILKTCADSMAKDTELIIVETFTDRQEYDNAKFVLEATSLYFTAIANGNSKMYASNEFIELIAKAGLKVEEEFKLGDYHTMLVCELV